MFSVEVCLSQSSRLIQTAKGAVEIACLGEGPTVLSTPWSTLILHGEADRDVLAEDARWAHGQIEGAELHWIPAGSHLAFWIAPDAAEAQAHPVAVLQKAAEPCADLSDGRADPPS